jgi:RHS repeat-associated protein
LNKVGKFNKVDLFMTDPMADNHRNSLGQRTVLLATDNKNSVFAEIAGGKPNSIAYSAYGQQSGQQEVATRLGFNGELREARIGWYLLGNGYRAYNPIFMRFHSPDRWSPFGNGGLNTYVYCVGDPVNFSDPTGHVRWGKMGANIFNFLFGGADITGPSRSKSLMASAPLGPMRPEKTGELKALGRISTVTASTPGPRGNNSPAISDIQPTTGLYHGYDGPPPHERPSYFPSTSRPNQNPNLLAGKIDPDRRVVWDGKVKEPSLEHNQLQGDAAGGHPSDLRGNRPLPPQESRELRLHRALARERAVNDMMQMRARQIREAGQDPRRMQADIARAGLEAGLEFNARFPPIRR